MSQVTYSNVVQGNMQKQIRSSSAHKNSVPEGCQGAKKASGAVHFVAHYAEVHLQYIFSGFFSLFISRLSQSRHFVPFLYFNDWRTRICNTTHHTVATFSHT